MEVEEGRRMTWKSKAEKWLKGRTRMNRNCGREGGNDRVKK